MTNTEVSPQWPTFPTRIMALPAVSDAYDFATHLYSKSKEYRVVGVVLGVAEGTLMSAVTVATPLATPLLGYVDHLKPLDDWACRRLDDVEKRLPAITKPTGEMLSATKQYVLVTVAGGEQPPSTLAEALATRAVKLAVAVKDQAVAASVIVPHRLLDAGHSLMDHYLPEEGSPEKQPDESEVSMVMRTVSLVTKASRRLSRAAHEYLYTSCPLDPTPSHLALECMQTISRKFPGVLSGVGDGEKSLIVVLVFVLPMKMTKAMLRFIIMVIGIFAEVFKRTQLKMKSPDRAVAEKNDKQAHED